MFLRRFLKISAYCILSILVFIILVILLMRTQWAQQRITNYVTNYISQKTNTDIKVNRLFVTFGGNVQLEGLYVADEQKDTLAYLGSLNTGLSFKSIIKRKLVISHIELEQLVTHVHNQNADSTLNYHFLIDAFAGEKVANEAGEKQDANKSESENFSLDIGKTKLNTLKVKYINIKSGFEAVGEIGSLMLNPGTIDINSMDFHLKELMLDRASINYTQHHNPEQEKNNSEEVINPPNFRLDLLTISKTKLHYHNLADSLFSDNQIQMLKISKSDLNLREQVIRIEQIALHKSDFTLRLPNDHSDEPDDQNPGQLSPFSWPGWVVELAQLDFENNAFSLKTPGKETKEGVFDSHNMIFNPINLKLGNLRYSPGDAALSLKKLQIRERSGLIIDHLAFEASLNDTSIELKKFKLLSPHNQWEAQAALTYSDFRNFLDDIVQNSHWDIELSLDRFSPADAYFFNDSLRYDSSLMLIEKLNPNLKLKVNGNTDLTEIRQLDLAFGNMSNLKVKGQLENFPDTALLRFDFPLLLFNTHMSDLKTFGLDMDSSAIALPESYSLNAQAKGQIKDFTANLRLSVDRQEHLHLKTRLTKETNQLKYEAELNATDIPLAKWFNNSSYHPLSFDLALDGKGTDLDDLTAAISLDFQKLKFNDYDYSPLKVRANFAERQLTSMLDFEDDNLLFESKINLVLFDSLNSQFSLDFNLQRAELMALGITTEPANAKIHLMAAGSQNHDITRFDVIIDHGSVIANNLRYPIDDFKISGFLDKDSTFFEWQADAIQARLIANANIEKTSNALQNHFKAYLDDGIADSIRNNVSLDLDIDILNTPLISSVFLSRLESFQPIGIHFHFEEHNQLLEGNITLPELNYAGIVLDSLYVKIFSDGENLDFSTAFAKIDAGMATINQTLFEANFNEEKINLLLNIKDEQLIDFFNLKAQLWQQTDSLMLQLINEDFILNSEPWQAMAGNRISWSDNHLSFEKLEIQSGKERLKFSSPSTTWEDLNILLSFSNFNLGNLLSLINPEEVLAEGAMNGELSLLKADEKFAFTAALLIDSLKIMSTSAGDLKLEVKNLKDNQYDFKMAMRGPADMDISGYYLATDESPELALDLALNKFSLELLAPLSSGVLRESKGYISGNLNINGPILNPVHSGEIRFNQASVLIAATNSRFSLPDERIKITNDLISLNKFTVIDEKGSKLEISGNVITKNLLNPELKLKLNTQNFQLLNSTKKDNDLFFGKAFIDAQIDLGGTAQRPDIDAGLKLKRGTDLVFVIPESQIDLVSRAGTVEFVSFDVEESEDPLQKDSLIYQSQVSGVRLRSVIQIDRETKFKVIVDQRSGDYLSVSGEADMSLDMSRNGNLSLFGIYEINKGSYELSMYELVKRKFEISEGSSIQWTGDPYNAKMDLMATYQVEASPTDLMADQISGADQSVQNKYRNQLPFIVQLIIKGELLQPQLSFGLDMPEERKGALDGSVYGKIQSLNRDENELNKQVFALLVLNRFFPSGSSGSSGPNTSQMARNSASQLLTNQLNALSDRFVKGVDLNLGVDSFTDYQSGSAQDRTQLSVNVSKSLFNERFVVSVGSQVDVEGSQRSQQTATDIIGNITLEYLLDEKGIYRLKGFRKNEFTGMIDGQLVVSGIAFLFNKEINRINELWEKEEQEIEE